MGWSQFLIGILFVPLWKQHWLLKALWKSQFLIGILFVPLDAFGVRYFDGATGLNSL